MKIVVVSDTHGDIDILKKVRMLNPNADMFLHCGDSELPPELLDGFATVKGNCDYFDYPISKTFDTPYGKIYMEHGNRAIIHNDSYIESLNAKIILLGHTHRHSLRIVGDTFVANPGSLTRPRDDTNGTYLIINIKSQNDFDFEFKEIN